MNDTKVITAMRHLCVPEPLWIASGGAAPQAVSVVETAVVTEIVVGEPVEVIVTTAPEPANIPLSLIGRDGPVER